MAILNGKNCRIYYMQEPADVASPAPDHKSGLLTRVDVFNVINIEDSGEEETVNVMADVDKITISKSDTVDISFDIIAEMPMGAFHRELEQVRKGVAGGFRDTIRIAFLTGENSNDHAYGEFGDFAVLSISKPWTAGETSKVSVKLAFVRNFGPIGIDDPTP